MERINDDKLAKAIRSLSKAMRGLAHALEDIEHHLEYVEGREAARHAAIQEISERILAQAQKDDEEERPW